MLYKTETTTLFENLINVFGILSILLTQKLLEVDYQNFFRWLL